MVALVWCFFSLVIVTYYLGSIVMILTTEQQIAGSIHTVEDLAKQSVVKYGTLSGGRIMTMFRVNNR